MSLLGEFPILLYDEEQLPVEEYVKGIDKKNLLRLASFLIGLDINSSKFYDWQELLNMWFREENLEFKKKIWERCSRHEIKHNAKLSLISPAASLKFFEFVFFLPDEVVTQDEISSEVNLFKAYLIFVSNTTIKEEVSAEYLEQLPGKLRIAATLLNQMYPLSDVTNYELGDVFVTQIIKAYYLFQFLESNKDALYLIQAFYSFFHIEDWKEYFQYVVPLIDAHSKHPSEGWTELIVTKNENFEKSCSFLESLSLKYFDQDMVPDFKMLRGNPIYRVDNGKYAIISPLFVVEKIFKGLYFKLKEIHEAIPKEKRLIKNLRSFYTTKFSENFLLYNILEYIYEDKNYVRFTGEEISTAGCPDYYLRNGNQLFIFENKDVFVNAEVKQSFDFSIVEEEFKKKFYFEDKQGKIDAKAVLQLANNVELALTCKNSFDQNYKARNLRIYPILVLHDSSFNCPGLNYLINHWFQIELSKLEAKGIDVSRVKPITVINIDTLILYADYLKLRKASLNDLIDSYIKFGIFNEKRKYKNFEELKAAYGKSLLSFSFFVDQITKAGFRKIPNTFRQTVMESIFPK